MPEKQKAEMSREQTHAATKRGLIGLIHFSEPQFCSFNFQHDKVKASSRRIIIQIIRSTEFGGTESNCQITLKRRAPPPQSHADLRWQAHVLKLQC